MNALFITFFFHGICKNNCYVKGMIIIIWLYYIKEHNLYFEIFGSVDLLLSVFTTFTFCIKV